MSKKKVFVETWGCQMNVADSETMLSMLQAQNYETTDKVEQADLVLLNTCHIREKATHKVLSRLGALRQVAELNPNMKIAVAGCVATIATQPANASMAAPYVVFNERQISGWASQVDVSNSYEMLRIVWAALPASVVVYPTETYYYFTVYVAGRTFTGNILLGPDYLDRGVFSFAYKEVSGNDQGRDPIAVEALYSRENGAAVQRVSKRPAAHSAHGFHC